MNESKGSVFPLSTIDDAHAGPEEIEPNKVPASEE